MAVAYQHHIAHGIISERQHHHGIIMALGGETQQRKSKIKRVIEISARHGISAWHVAGSGSNGIAWRNIWHHGRQQHGEANASKAAWQHQCSSKAENENAGGSAPRKRQTSKHERPSAKDSYQRSDGGVIKQLA